MLKPNLRVVGEDRSTEPEFPVIDRVAELYPLAY